MRKTLILCLSLMLSGASIAQGAETEPVGSIQVPKVKMGDQCVYRHIDMKTGQSPYTISNTVTKITADTIEFTTERSYPDGRKFPGLRIVNHELNTLAAGKRKMKPFYPGFSFPISPGKVTPEMVVTYPGSNNTTVTAKLSSTVAKEWSVLEVPAGKFKVLKITQTGTFQNSNGADGEMTDIISMSLDTWCHIRWEYEEKPKYHTARELVSFSNQK